MSNRLVLQGEAARELQAVDLGSCGSPLRLVRKVIDYAETHPDVNVEMLE